jgi:cob(I)alamin adenosyltransferase
VRRAERRVIELRDEEGLDGADIVIRFLNRASDLVYAMARFADVDSPEVFEGRDAARS